MANVWLEWDEIYPVYFVSREDEPVSTDSLCLTVPDEVLSEWLTVQARFDELQAELRNIREATDRVVKNV